MALDRRGEEWWADDGALFVKFDGDGRIEMVVIFRFRPPARRFTLLSRIRARLGL